MYNVNILLLGKFKRMYHQWKQELLTIPEHLSSDLGFQWWSYCSIFSFMCGVLQIIVCPFFIWLLCCLSFDLCILITSLWYLQTLLTVIKDRVTRTPLKTIGAPEGQVVPASLLLMFFKSLRLTVQFYRDSIQNQIR